MVVLKLEVSAGNLAARIPKHGPIHIQWEQARVALVAAINLYRAMAMTFWLPQAEAALAQVG
jgi:hypothetical protein